MKNGVVVYALVCLAWFGFVAGLSMWQGYPQAALTLAVPAQERLFGDMRIVVEGIEAAGRGRDVIGSDYKPTDYFPIRFPYHRSWLALRHLGIGGSDTVGLSVALGLLLFAHYGVLVAVTGNHPLTGLMMAAFACSPPVMLAIERGNPDLFLYLVLAGACHLLARRSLPAQAIGASLMFVAGALKFFPFAGALGILPGEHRRRRLALFATVSAAAIAFLAIERSEVMRIVSSPLAASDWASFGSAVSANMVVQSVPRWLGIPLPETAAGILRVCGVLVLLAAAIRLALSIGREDAWAEDVSGVAASAFVAAAGIFTGSFVLMRSYNYKFIFVALTIPALCLWARRRDAAGATARVALATLLFWIWSGINGYAYILANAAVAWVCVACFASLLMAWLGREAGVPVLTHRMVRGHR
jgi:hypothetical protein